MCTYTHAEASSEPYLITILLIVQPVGVARGGEKESKTVSFREGQREREREGGSGVRTSREPEAVLRRRESTSTPQR